MNKVEQEADGGRFTGAVGPQKTEYLTPVHLKIDVSNTPVFTIKFGEVFGYNYATRSFISKNLNVKGIITLNIESMQ